MYLLLWFVVVCIFFFVCGYCAHRALPGLTHSFPTRLSSCLVRDHRGEIRLRRDLAVDQRFARELAHGRALLDELDLEPEQYAGFDRSPEFRQIGRAHV